MCKGLGVFPVKDKAAERRSRQAEPSDRDGRMRIVKSDKIRTGEEGASDQQKSSKKILDKLRRGSREKVFARGMSLQQVWVDSSPPALLSHLLRAVLGCVASLGANGGSS